MAQKNGMASDPIETSILEGSMSAAASSCILVGIVWHVRVTNMSHKSDGPTTSPSDSVKQHSLLLPVIYTLTRKTRLRCGRRGAEPGVFHGVTEHQWILVTSIGIMHFLMFH